MALLDLVLILTIISSLLVAIKLIFSEGYIQKLLCFYFIFNCVIIFILLKSQFTFDKTINLVIILSLLELVSLLFLTNLKNRN